MRGYGISDRIEKKNKRKLNKRGVLCGLTVVNINLSSTIFLNLLI